VDLDESRVVAQLQHSLLPLAKLLNLIRFDAPSEVQISKFLLLLTNSLFFF